MGNSVEINISRQDLALLSMQELSVVMDAVTLARDGLLGVKNQPRCFGSSLVELEYLVSSFNEVVDLIAEVAEQATPETADEATIRAYMIIHHETTYPDVFKEVLVSATIFQQSIEALQVKQGASP
jgi:hypothetical protein